MTAVRRLPIGLVVAGIISAGCTMLASRPLELAPGHRVVVGRVELSGVEGAEGLLEVVREDRAYQASLPIDRSLAEFAVGLPPGRYRVTRLRAWKDARAMPSQVVWDLPPLAFVVGHDPAVYIGTLRVDSSFGRVRVSVVDEQAATLRVLRARYPNVPATVARSLAAPA